MTCGQGVHKMLRKARIVQGSGSMEFIYFPFMRAILSIFLVSMIVQSLCGQSIAPIDREALVKRHTVRVDRPDSLSSLSVGNGAFACTVDVTGLESFPEDYAAGVPLVPESEWGWHSFPDTGRYSLEES